jgi:hypothetical protein
MSKKIINPNSIRAGTPDWQEGYEQGLLAGYTKSIVLIRHLQRTLSPNENITPKSEDRVKARLQREILKKAMELIAENIEEE